MELRIPISGSYLVRDLQTLHINISTNINISAETGYYLILYEKALRETNLIRKPATYVKTKLSEFNTLLKEIKRNGSG